MSASSAPLRRPALVLCESDRAVLERASLLAILDTPRLAGPLLEEVDRAEVVPDADLSSRRVRLGSLVTYRDDVSGRRLAARLVEDPRTGRSDELSVLTPAGAALVGLEVGQSILWRDRRGGQRRLTVLGTAFGGEARP